jgi:prevent-host-death family protein
MNITATELKQRSGQVLDDAQREPVKVVKHGRIYGAVISKQDLEVLENAKRLDSLKSSVQAGFTQIENGQYSTRSVDDIFQEAKKRVESRRNENQ